ncbi:hypothetical protein RCL1_004000 [Eukaryota sp. TZLM3-RCL]
MTCLESVLEPKYCASACIFVANIAETPNVEEDLRMLFSAFGPVLRVRCLADKSQRTFYSFIQFADAASAKIALDNSKTLSLHGRMLRCEAAQTNTTLFVARIGRNTVEEDLLSVFSVFGEIEKVSIVMDHITQRSRGCGFVKFKFREDAIKALAAVKKLRRSWVVEFASSEGKTPKSPSDGSLKVPRKDETNSFNYSSSSSNNSSSTSSPQIPHKLPASRSLPSFVPVHLRRHQEVSPLTNDTEITESLCTCSISIPEAQSAPPHSTLIIPRSQESCSASCGHLCGGSLPTEADRLLNSGSSFSFFRMDLDTDSSSDSEVELFLDRSVSKSLR